MSDHLPRATTYREGLRQGRKGLRPLRLLLVDDCKDMVESMSLVLRMLGYEVCGMACDGPSALKAAQATRPDVVLLDLGIPGLSGYEVARRIRHMAGLESVLLIAMTGFADDAHRLQAEEAGFDSYLVKPAELETLTRLLEVRRATDLWMPTNGLSRSPAVSEPTAAE